ITKNNNIILTLEDSTAEIKVLVSKSKPDNYEMAKNIVFDEVIGIVGMNGDNIVFANKVILPDVPLNKELKKLDEEVYVVFLSDIHVGSNNFLPEQFNKFLNWINGNFGSEQQRHIASKVKYVFVIGDLVDGVGIYPGQEKELVINEINEQYNECARLLSKIPTNIRIIICPGNHDAMRISEPQLPLYKDFASAIWRMPNTIMVSNPALVNIAAKENFSGFDVLMYHGYSFDYYVAHVDSIRQQGGYDRADLIMKFLLQKRHLAPTHRSTLYIADTKKDPLVISQIPDFFVTGHIHKSSVSEYRNITLICGSCWQSKTSFQEKVGHNPEPARVPVVNLQSREIKVLRF
ncbi:MAG: metallophosphoesterase, partial [Nanoarchaeota archaeon]|nr:metallophosphoesterase [Nanoarchaeota archaeon]